MVIAVNPNKTFEYTLKREQGSADATVWILGVLTAQESASIKDQAIRVTGTAKGDDVNIEMKDFYASRLHTVRLGLRGWRNFKDPDGNEVVFQNNMAANVNRIPGDVLDELADVITDGNVFSQAEVKNSD